MDIADILIHVHPTLDNEQREQVEKALLEQQSVVMAHFSPGQPHTLVVAFDPATVQSGQLLQIVREWDQTATLVGL